ncbi:MULTISPECIES: primase-helicase zinc-binding domain-containing protein [Serratia]|nr:primase-helicase zinc-binding domain-containing protein [Serratia marcescens]MCS1373839.1 hypothetical protein [Serratia marcescens]
MIARSRIACRRRPAPQDHFRFDNMDGVSTWFCNQCGAGDAPWLTHP